MTAREKWANRVENPIWRGVVQIATGLILAAVIGLFAKLDAFEEARGAMGKVVAMQAATITELDHRVTALETGRKDDGGAIDELNKGFSRLDERTAAILRVVADIKETLARAPRAGP